ncbi:MAG: UDP-3-O-(3-hydroxymyristoyl)glucosamine N-acyltransferase [Bacteroidales bacterium]|nr:UDP-3-O-(3-hydroxymyristoyl)glucosamine N-acyltransferase [Bacteroidales bacterium]MDT8431780.1 UDP-3-O-(3-hydroxymyristoyl)glucosamine N-acyltransferase [Bacteroidales bacterium]
MNFTAKMIAEMLRGTVEGDPETSVTDVARIEEGKPGALSFLANPKYEKHVYTTGSSVIIVNQDFKAENPVSATLIRVSNAYEAFAELLNLYEKNKPKKSGISPMSAISKKATTGKDLYVGEFAVISDGAVIGNNVQIYPQVYIGENAEIGDHTILYPGVKIYHDCIIGANCIFHSGAVIGGDGFGFVPNDENVYSKVPQLGNVVIEDHVEIGANSTVDRATLGSTMIRQGVKLDNLIMVAHNVEIGKNTVMAAQVGIAGSTKIGADCLFGGQAGLAGHIKIADGVKIGAQAGISNSIKKEDVAVMGSPAFNLHAFYKSYAIFRKLPELWRQLQDLEREVAGKSGN